MSKRFQLKQPHEYRRKYIDSQRHVGLGLERIKSCYLSQSILYNNTDWVMMSDPAIVTLTRYLKIILDNAMRPKDAVRAMRNKFKLELNPSLGRIIQKLKKAFKLTDVYKKNQEGFQGLFDG